MSVFPSSENNWSMADFVVYIYPPFFVSFIHLSSLTLVIMPLSSSLSWISSSRHDRIFTIDTALAAVAGITACAGTYYIIRQLTRSSSKKYAGFKKIPEPKGAYPYVG